jgi:large-conductance mechanosensitive channel
MIDFAIGVAVGTAFAPFWMMMYNMYIKPTVTKLFIKKP